MADTFTPTLKARRVEQGAYSGDPQAAEIFNADALDIMDAGIDGKLTIDIGSATTYALEAMQNGTLSQTHYKWLIFIGTPASPVVVTVPASVAPSKNYLVQNDTGQPLTFKYAATAGVVVASGETIEVQCDGTDVRPYVYGGAVISQAEIDEGVTIVDGTQPIGYLRRYGTNSNPGVTDMTSAIADWLAISDRHLAYCDPEVYLTDKQTPPANAQILLPPGCVLKDIGNLGASDRLINIINDNVHITGWGATIEGSQSEYTPGFQHHNVYIYEAHDTVIEGLRSTGAPGDGFYIGGDAGDPATNVRLDGCRADANYRNGMSIVNCRKARILDFESTGNTGTAPASGIQIEPTATTDILEDINISRPRCADNDGEGMQIFLGNWNSASNVASINVIDAFIKGNGQGLVGSCGICINRMKIATPARGVIKIVNARCIEEEYAGIQILDWDVAGPRIEIIRPHLHDCNQSLSASSIYGGGIVMYSGGAQTTTPGNVRIESPRIYHPASAGNNPISIHDSGGGHDNIVITDPEVESASFANRWFIGSTTSGVRITSIRPLPISLPSGGTMTDGRYIGRVVNNAGATGTTTIVLPAASANKITWRLRFEVAVAHEMRIDPAGSDLIRGGTAGQYASNSVIGSSLEIECDSATSWKVVNVVGPWPFT